MCEQFETLFKKGVYLDHAATSFPKPDCVVQSINNYIVNNGASSSRGGYGRAIKADYMVYETRKWIGELFNHKKPSDIIFTSGVTESLNGIMRGILKDGDHVITSSIEHNAVWRCLKTLERDRNISITTVKTTKEGITNHKDIEDNIQRNTKLIVFNHASNVIGTIQPIREIGKIARKYSILFLLDTAQTAGILPIDMEADNIDILAFTGHKGLLGPSGTGGLIINWDGDIEEWKSGGTGGNSADPFMPEILPNKFEAGTMNMVGIAGLHASIRYLLDTGVDKICAVEKEVIGYTLEQLGAINGIQIFGTNNVDLMVGAISFTIDGIDSGKAGSWLDKRYHIMVRTGIHCAPILHKIMGTDKTGTIRIGIGYSTTKEEIDYFIYALKELLKEQLN
ncbi:aminotransferase class V-fold PLP-dependent enzyme [Alkalibaculum sp. M08DMB]|uniref:cysteine desulfurase n=1 Tax=Alkalibaculum sporogenes TaxID=2655001 RepID=A0A6A7K4M7_9FIRM|nr:aminotransferase class V-fold PLP-dependent enzyme [Alkalibaculum sporogenes]